MHKKFSLSKVPGWVIILTVGAILYFTGVHTEVLGRLQGFVLKTGLIKPDISGEINEEAESIYSHAGRSFKISSLSGKTISMENFHGKTIFLNLWATWCPPCIAEMPNIENLYNKVHSDEIVFIMLSLDKEKEKAKRFIENKKYTFPVYTPESPMPDALNTSVIPTTFIISPEGKIVLKKEGMANYDTQEFVDFLNEVSNSSENL